jgi:WhiB family redox-sensing transcriptional regulator
MGVDPDLFFPERGASTREAREVCRGCVVRGDCLEYALANAEKFGIWGGLSERERRRLRRQRAAQRRTVLDTSEVSSNSQAEVPSSYRTSQGSLESQVRLLLRRRRGAIIDEGGGATAILAGELGLTTDSQMSHLSYTLLKMERAGLVMRRIQGKRTYAIGLPGQSLRLAQPASNTAQALTRQILVLLGKHGGVIEDHIIGATKVIAAELGLTSRTDLNQLANCLVRLEKLGRIRRTRL